MVEKKTIYQQQLELNPNEVKGDMNKLEFPYSIQVGKIIAISCEGKQGDEFKQCFKEHSKVLSQVYSLEDYYSDNFNLSRNHENSREKSVEIVKKILK